MNRIACFLAAAVLVVMIGGGCATIMTTTLDIVVTSFMNALGEMISDGIDGMIASGFERVSRPQPEFSPPESQGWSIYMVSKAQAVFDNAFSPVGFWFGKTPYQPGEWTEFEVVSGGESVIIGKALLSRFDDGGEVWTLTVRENGEKVAFEVRISSDGRPLRLWGMDSDGAVGEIPLTDDTVVLRHSPVVPQEEIVRNVTGRETVCTPAGEYETDHIKFVSKDDGNTLESWISSSVPGGTVKYRLSSKNGIDVCVCTLIKKGDNATSPMKNSRE